MDNAQSQLPIIGVIGGTGALGQGIALRAAAAGYPVLVGSRSAERAQGAVEEMRQAVPGSTLSAHDYESAAAAADIVILAVPYAAHGEALRVIAPHMAGKILVDTTVPLVPPAVARVQLPSEGSAAQQSRAAMDGKAKVVAAFHNVAAAKLSKLDQPVDCDVLVFGDDKEAREVIVTLIDNMQMKAWHAGSLDNAVVGEALTSTLIFINKTYKIAGAGIRITGEARA